MKTYLFQSCGHCWVFQICWPISDSAQLSYAPLMSLRRLWLAPSSVPSVCSGSSWTGRSCTDMWWWRAPCRPRKEPGTDWLEAQLCPVTPGWFQDSPSLDRHPPFPFIRHPETDQPKAWVFNHCSHSLNSRAITDQLKPPIPTPVSVADRCCHLRALELCVGVLWTPSGTKAICPISSILGGQHPWPWLNPEGSVNTFSWRDLAEPCLRAWCVHAKSLQLCLTLCDPMEDPILHPWDSPGKNTGVCCPPPEDLPNPGIEPSCLHCRWILYHWAIREAWGQVQIRNKRLNALC